ncbi:MAG: branched-chain amino acid ABC transporter permease [Candidatus Rokubacteria bacterium]|nr:branched-chain amino acid ABC transporter permease [Candidatus Rokubacteria bacterium]
MRTAIELLVNGVLLGGIYALMACGLNLIFGVMRVINFAHGEFLSFGALLGVSLVIGFGVPFLLAVVLVAVAIGLFGFLMQAALVERVVDGPPIMSLLLTYSASTVFVNGGLLIWGGGYQGMPGVFSGSVSLGPMNLSQARLVAFTVAVVLTGLVYAFLAKSMFGKAIRAVSEQPEIATVSGIAAAQIRYLTFGLGGLMAGAAGVLLAPMFASDPQMGARFVIKAFTVIVVGGLGSYVGAFVGALTIGVVEVVGGYLVGQTFATALLYFLMIAFLLLRPSGLFGVGIRR